MTSIDGQPFIPSYLKGTSIEKLQNSDESFLPTCFEEYSARYVKCMDNKLMIKYTGPGIDDTQAESISTDFPVPPEVLLYYFEVDIIDKGEHGYIGIGFAKNLDILDILPGWRFGTMGYHGDDGRKFFGEAYGKRYGPLYSTGDTIGCCVNFVDKHVFYTKNGINLGIAFKAPFNDDLFPIVGMRTRGECVEANFGTKPFKFNIDSYAKAFFSEPRIIAQEDILRQQIDYAFPYSTYDFDSNSYSTYDFDERPHTIFYEITRRGVLVYF
ncbi:concanavalin A-like lectin/glucanase domain-containing protein [Gigaspora rosea]|uniref:Concanavalin A-like lectin/glucanase domain-containing protein n=1 Tax=Gigaspora rosea TaxID=44941 RepID=A0A397TYW3_9GLOM|nr:concanavalin A-like lectin/glucanase domain-containing protein [Gigaspora rosea]